MYGSHSSSTGGGGMGNYNIKATTKPKASNYSSIQDKYDRFEAWLRENGARFDLLELREYDCGKPSGGEEGRGVGHGGGGNHEILDNVEEEKKEQQAISSSGGSNSSNSRSEATESEMRGVHARVHIGPGTVCMSIPRRCLITVEMGQATPIGQAILNADLDLDAPKHIFLMIYILWDRKVNGAKSFFYPYYEILPRTLSNMPIFWTEEELNELQGSYLLHQIHDRSQAITEDYYAICSIAPELESLCTLDEFKWARMCVCSRNFGLQIDGHRTSAMVPHADMLNHYRPRETKWTFDEDRQAFTITTLQHIPPGAQVYDSYGQKCNHRFLLNYGFAVEENREIDGFCPNEVPIELYVHPDDPLFSEKMEFWTRGEVATTSNTNKPSSGSSTTASTTPNRKQQLRQPVSPEVTQQSAKQKASPTPVVKRVRVCVSNNENTRLLFSLLRALACNEAELKAISLPIASSSSSTSSAFGAGGSSRSSNRVASNTKMTSSNTIASPHRMNRTVDSRATTPSTQSTLFGNIASADSSSSSQRSSGSAPTTTTVLTGSPAPVGATYHRSCRDIRHPISLRNERAAMRLLLAVIGRQLSQYPTTLQQDLADLLDWAAYPRFSNKRHAKIQVRGEKEVLHHYVQWARTALDVLDVIEEELKEERGSVEVKLMSTGRLVTEERPGFDYFIQRLEEESADHHDDGNAGNGGLHHTITRYCADVLGSLRREEFKNIRRQRAQVRLQQQQQQYHQSMPVSGQSNSNNSSTSTTTSMMSMMMMGGGTSSSNNNNNNNHHYDSSNNNKNNTGATRKQSSTRSSNKSSSSSGSSSSSSAYL